MSVVRAGSNEKYAEGWAKAFSGKKATKSAKKKVATKAAPKKKASAKKKR